MSRTIELLNMRKEQIVSHISSLAEDLESINSQLKDLYDELSEVDLALGALKKLPIQAEPEKKFLEHLKDRDESNPMHKIGYGRGDES